MGVYVPLNYANVVIPFRLTGDLDEMVVTLGVENIGSARTATQIAQFVQDELFDETIFAADSFAPEWTVGPVRATLTTVLGPIEGIATGTRTGTNAGIDTLPQNNAILVQKRTLRGGRAGRGRMYFPPFFPTEGAVQANGVIDSAIMTGWQLSMDNWRSEMAAGDCPMVLFHSPQENGDPPLLNPDDILQLVVSNVIATQRTRLRR